MLTLKVMTLNLRGYRANWLSRRARLLRLIDEQQIDIVLLQEAVDRTLHTDQAREIAQLIDYHVSYYPAQRFVPWPAVSIGQGILSRYPILEDSVVELVPQTSFWPRGPYQRRVVQRAEIDCQGMRLAVFNTHMPLSRENRTRASKSLWQEVAIEKAPFAILGGDFNALPIEETMRFLRGEAELNGIRGALTDSWMVAGSGAGATFPAASPKVRIDYLFYSAIDSVKVIESKVVGLAPDILSDHAGVITSFQMNPVEELLLEEEEEIDPYRYHGKGEDIAGIDTIA